MNYKSLTLLFGAFVVIASVYVALSLFKPCNGDYEFNLKEARFICKNILIPYEDTKSVKETVISPSGFKVVLDGDCPNDSPEFTGANDPMGTIRCGNTYTVVYDTNNGSWTVTGFHEVSKSDETHIYQNANPDINEISLWGRVFTFDEDKNVFDPEFGKVGRIIPK